MSFIFLNVFPVTCFLGGREEYGRLCRWYHLTWFCEVEIVHREEAEADVPDDVTASCYDCQITTQVLSCIKCDGLCNVCVPINMDYAITKEKGMYAVYRR